MNRAIRKNYIRFTKEPGFRFISYLTLAVLVISTILLSINIVGTTYNYNIGDIAREDIKNNREIQYINESETEMARNRAAENVPLVFDKDQSILTDSIRRVDKFFDYVKKVLSENPPAPGTEDRTYQLIALKDTLPKNFAYNDRTLWNVLRSDNLDELKRTVNRILIFIFDRGISENSFIKPTNTNNENVSIRTINTSEELTERSNKIADIRTLNDIKRDLGTICYSISANKSKDRIQAIYDIVNMELTPNLKFNLEETKRRIDEIVKTVKPVMGTLKKGQMIVRDGDTITTESLNNIKILNKNIASTNITYTIGIILLQLTILLVSFFFSDEPDNKSIHNKKIPIIIFSLVLFFIIFTFILSKTPVIYNSSFIFSLFLPIPFVFFLIISLFIFFFFFYYFFLFLL